jgi:D-inositol-3-phosphate glycosyltransferase
MRIALITAHDPLSPAADQQPQSLARALVRRGHRVTIYARSQGNGCPPAAIAGGVSIEHVCAGPARLASPEQAAAHVPELAAALADRWRARNPDVVHAFSWTSGLAALAAVRGTGVPVVQTFGSLGHAERRHGVAVPESRLRLEPAIARSVSAVLASSADEAAELARHAVPKSAMRVIPAGIDTDTFCPEGAKDARGTRARLVSVVPPGQPHGLALVLRALVQLRDAELVVVGGPDAKHMPKTGEFRDLTRLASALGVRSRVRFAGELGPDGFAALLRSADVLVSAAPYDPSGLAAIQAMACGTPAVVSGVGGQQDAVVDGTTGLVVPPRRSDLLVHRLRALLGAPALLQAYGIAAADRARARYCWERVATETAAVYQRCRPEAGGLSRSFLADDDEADDEAVAEADDALALFA